MAPIVLAGYGLLATGVAYLARIIGPKVRPGDEVLINAMNLPVGGVPAALGAYGALLIQVTGSSGETFSGNVVGGSAATQADGTFVITRLPAGLGMANLPNANVIKGARYTG